MSATAKPQTDTLNSTGEDQHISEFKPFKWTPDLPLTTPVSARDYCQLVNSAKDVASGALLVLGLIDDYESATNDDEPTYLNPCTLGNLKRLAMYSLESLEQQASEAANRLHQLERGQSCS